MVATAKLFWEKIIAIRKIVHHEFVIRHRNYFIILKKRFSFVVIEIILLYLRKVFSFLVMLSKSDDGSQIV